MVRWSFCLALTNHSISSREEHKTRCSTDITTHQTKGTNLWGKSRSCPYFPTNCPQIHCTEEAITCKYPQNIQLFHSPDSTFCPPSQPIKTCVLLTNIGRSWVKLGWHSVPLPATRTEARSVDEPKTLPCTQLLSTLHFCHYNKPWVTSVAYLVRYYSLTGRWKKVLLRSLTTLHKRPARERTSAHAHFK